MSKSTSYKIFKQGSSTFFVASSFFPAKVKKSVFDLYAFVRVADDFVDSIPPKRTEYYQFKDEYYMLLSTNAQHGSEVIRNFINVQREYGFPQEWVDSFFASMEMDFTKKSYSTLVETEQYIYGSAEVIGLMMSKIMNLDPQSYKFAQLLGKAFQYMNMIRDVSEDIKLGRVYLPLEDFTKFGLMEISQKEAQAKPEVFTKFIQQQIGYYYSWRDEAKLGFKFIPKRYLIPIQIALNLFDDTITKIYQNPQLIFNEKIKPTKLKIATVAIKQLINL